MMADPYENLERMEPDISPSVTNLAIASIAISMKRIADAFEALVELAERTEAKGVDTFHHSV